MISSLYEIINGIDRRFINEDKFTISYTHDGKDEVYNVTANDERDAEDKFEEYMKDNSGGASYKKTGIAKALDEDNPTGNLDGGLGQPKTPFAFQRKRPTKSDKDKETENATSSTGFKQAPTTNLYRKRVEELYGKVASQIEGIGIVEAKYADYANDESMSASQKINTSIQEINRKLYEVDRLLTHAMKLKNETGLNQDVFWKSTATRFGKISDKILKIGNKLREFNQ